MKKLRKNLNKYIIIMFILIIGAEILLRINNKLLNICGIVCFPLIIIFGIILLVQDKKKK